MSEFTGAAKPLSETGLTNAAGDIGVGLPELWAVMTVETKGCGFLPDRRPLILFERHVFHKRTAGKYAIKAPDLSDPVWGGYGAGGANQYDRLQRAMKFDRKAALESTSWGLGQVMGFNAAQAGYASAEEMALAMRDSEDAQFQAMIDFIESNQLEQYLQSADWAKFARRYNGADFQKNKYDEKLRLAHARFSVGPLPSLRVRSAQLYLSYLGYTPGGVDGWYGNNTQKALLKFQKDRGLPATGEIDDPTLTALEKAASALI